MAEHSVAADDPNPCCRQWKDNFSKLQQRYKKTDDARVALRKAIGIFEQQLSIAQDENQKLKDAYKNEKLQVDQEKEKDAAARVSLEDEISALKSKISSLSQKRGSETEGMGKELVLLQGRVSDSEKELKCLQERLQKEISVADAERTKAIQEKKRADEAWETAKAEKSRAVDELSHLKARLHSEETEKKQLKKNLKKERARADSEKKKADEARESASRADEELGHLKARLCSWETEKDQLRKNLQETQAIADSEKKEADEARESARRADEELGHLKARLCSLETEKDQLSKNLQKEQAMADSEKKKADEAWESAKAEKSRADEELGHLKARLCSKETENNQLRKNLQTEQARTDSEKKKADEAWESAKAEKSRADEELGHLNVRLRNEETENEQLRKNLQKEQARADSEKKRADEALEAAGSRAEEENVEKVRGMVIDSLDDDISSLKSQNLLLQHKVDSANQNVDVVAFLQGHVSEMEIEISRLKERLDKERIRADSEMKKAERDNKKANEAWEKSKAFLQGHVSELETEISRLKELLDKERIRADSEMKKAETENQKANEAWENSKAFLQGHVSELETEISRLKELLDKERIRADSEMKKAETENKKANEAWENSKAFLQGHVSELETEISRLKELLDKERIRADSEMKKAETENKKANEAWENSKAFLQGHVSELETEISRLKELLDKERIRADSEMKKAEAENKKRNEAWENSKAEKSATDELRRLVDVERKKAEEIGCRLERLKLETDETRSKLVLEIAKSKEANRKLEAERQKVTKEKKKAEEQKAIAEVSKKNALEEKHRADSLYKQLEDYQQKYNKLKKEMEQIVSARKVVEAPVYVPGTKTLVAELGSGGQGEMVKQTANETKSEKLIQDLGQVKQKVNRGRNCADLEMKKAAEQKKVIEMYKVQAKEEKARANRLAQQLEDTKQKTRDLSKEIQDLLASRNLTEASTAPIREDMKAKSAKIKLLKKELKLEKMRVKHANQVAELEKDRKNMLEQEQHRLKLEFAQFSDRIGLSSCYAVCNVGKSHLEKNGNISSKRKCMHTEVHPLLLQSGKELLKSTCAATNASECFKESINCTAPSLLIAGTCNETTSGTPSKMEPLLRGSNRKNLHCSALDSSTTSFSDRQLVGSQGKDVFSNYKSAERARGNSNLHLPISKLSSEVNKTGYNVVVTEDNAKSPVRLGSKDGHIKKRKRIVNAIESIEHLCSEGKMWHEKVAQNISMLHGMLGHMKPSEEGMFSDHNQHHKRRKTYIEEVPMRHSCNSSEQKEEARIKPVGDVDVNLSGFADNVKDATYTSNKELDKVGSNNLEIFKKMLDGDCMKLLNLDNPVEEELYRAAIEMPLSPTLPEIEFQNNQPDDINDSRRSIVNCSSGGLPSTSTCIMPCCSSDVRSKEINCKKSTVKICGDPLEIFRKAEAEKSSSMHAISACIGQVQDSAEELVILNTRDKGSKTLCENRIGSAHDDSYWYFVVFQDSGDNYNLSKICCTTRTIRSSCHTLSQTDSVVRHIISALAADENLSPKERVSVFFSALLNSFSGNAWTSFNHIFEDNILSCTNIVSGQIRKVMSDAEMRTIFAERCNLDELIRLIENFIIDGIVLADANISSKTLPLSDPKFFIFSNGESVPLSYCKASLHLLVFGAVVLASLCAVFDRIDVVCEAAYSVSRWTTGSSTQTFLHVFAYICGDKYFSLGDYSLIMTAAKSLVTYYERENLSSGFPSCTKCPFSESAVSMEELASLLLERLQSYALCVQCKGGIACYMHGFETTVYMSKTVPDGTLCNLGDVLSLLELLAAKMSWGWGCENIVGPLLKLLEVCVIEIYLTAISALLGQISRLGIDANGFQDVEVEKIRVNLCSLLSRSTSSKFSLPVQFSVVKALLDTTPLDFQETVKNSKELPTATSPSTPADCIRKWFSLLNNEQKSLSFRLLTASKKHIERVDKMIF